MKWDVLRATKIIILPCVSTNAVKFTLLISGNAISSKNGESKREQTVALFNSLIPDTVAPRKIS